MKRYFKICLWSPIWFPILIGLIAYTVDSLFDRSQAWLPDWLMIAGAFVLYSVVFGGLQYLVMLLCLWPRINFASFKNWRDWALKLPLIFTPIQLGMVMLVFIWEIKKPSELLVVMYLGLLDLVIGYAYVAVWLLGYYLIRLLPKGRRFRGELRT